MEKETELLPSRKSGENGGIHLKPLQPLPLGKVGLFKLPPVDTDDDDDDANDCISLKEWQPSEAKPPSLDSNGLSYSAWQPVKEKDTPSNGTPAKGSARSCPAGYAPLVESNGDICLPPSIHGSGTPLKLPPLSPEEEEEEEEEVDDDDEQQDDQDNGGYEDGLDDDLEDDVDSESTNHATELEDAGHRPKVSHHQHNISLVNGIAPQPNHPTGGIAFDISLDDGDDGRPRRSTGSSRGSSLRVSFTNEVVLDSPSPPRHSSKSPLRSRPSHSKSPAKSRPGWDSSAKIGKAAAPLPKRFVRPTLHGIKVKKGQGGVAKTAMRASTSVLDSEHGVPAREGRPREAVARSWDPQQHSAGGEYDAVAHLISRSLVSTTEDIKKGDSNGVSSKPGRPFLPRTNGAGKNGEHETHNGAEVLKAKDFGNESNTLTGDITKLINKALRRASAPLSKPPSKPQHAVNLKPSPAPLISKMSRANSAPAENPKPNKKSLAPLHSLDSSGANQKYAIGSYASLKLLQECAQTEKIAPIPAATAHKPRKIRDHEPHRHYYKTISKTLDSKLK